MGSGEDAQQQHTLWVCSPGSLPYREAVELQARVRARRLGGEIPDTLIVLEHPPVYTRGRRALPEELALGEDFYRSRGIDVLDTDRGGRVTYHAPGQLVGYPIMRVGDVGAHLRAIEGSLIEALAAEGVIARSRCSEGADYTGVWVEGRKIASLGVHVSRAVSTHGFAVNVELDLAPFSWVVACGLPDVQMTSLANEIAGGERVDAERFRERVVECFARAHGRTAQAVSLDRLDPQGRRLRRPRHADVELAGAGASR
jgi:lipoyl(octanoyl) transferase